MVGLGGLEPPTSPLSGVRSNQAELQTHKNGNVLINKYVKTWWVWEDLNFRPHPYQGCALTKLSYRPKKIGRCILQLIRLSDNQILFGCSDL